MVVVVLWCLCSWWWWHRDVGCIGKEGSDLCLFQPTVLLDVLVLVNVRLASTKRGLREADPADVLTDPADRRQQRDGQSVP